MTRRLTTTHPSSDGTARATSLTITGTGFGPAPLVTIDGQPVTVLAGATDTVAQLQQQVRDQQTTIAT